MVDLNVRFNQWAAGNAGRVDPSLAPDGAWYGSNVQMYPSGLVGPRWGLKAVSFLAPGGGPLTIPVAAGPKGFAAIGNNLLVTADKTYIGSLASLATGTVTSSAFAAYAAAPSTWVTFVPQTADIIMALADNALYKHTVSTLATSSVATPATFSYIRRWGLYCVAVDKNTPYRLWFSQVTSGGFDFSTWPVGNFLDVGDAEPITAIVPLYNTLFVGKRSGWWAVTGVIGTSSAVRQVDIGDGPVDARGASATVGNRIAYWPRSPNPAYFNGSRSSLLLDHVTSVYNPQAAQAVIAAPTGRTTVFGYDAGGNSAALMVAEVGGASVHQFGVTLAGWAPDVIENGYSVNPGYILAAKQTTIVGETLQVYFWRIDPDRPPLSTDTLGSYGDGTGMPLAASLTTKSWSDSQGRDCRVRSVTVRFRAWGIGSTGAKLDPGFGVSVERIGPFDDSGDTSTEQHWQLPYGDVSVSGEDYTARFAIGEQGFATGFRINITDMKGVAIRDIVTGIDLRGPRT